MGNILITLNGQARDWWNTHTQLNRKEMVPVFVDTSLYAKAYIQLTPGERQIIREHIKEKNNASIFY